VSAGGAAAPEPRAGDGALRLSTVVAIVTTALVWIVWRAPRYLVAPKRWNPAWPVWADQVDAWRRDPRGPLHIWPRGWTMRLVPKP
jgi:hypothetical protein